MAIAMAAAIVVAAGCSMVKLGYGQVAPIAFRWLDRYADFGDAQSLRVRTALDDALAWHRRTQLPDYADWLTRTQVEVAGDVSAERMCALAADVRARLDALVQYALPTIPEVAATLTPAQLAHIEKRQAEANDEYRRDYVQRDPRRRLAAAVKREIERAEGFYGDLDDVQRELIARTVAASPFDGELALAERRHRQQDAVALARRLAATPADRAENERQVRAYLDRVATSPREGYRTYSERLVAWNCAFASALHKTTSAEQRRAAAKKLRGWATDLRALAAEASG